jgi:adenylate cyclase
MAQKRQLAAILFADIQDFTALVQQDESNAKIVQDKFHKVLENGVRNHHGRVIHFKGDGGCCIFRSAVDAVLASIEVQQQMLHEPKVPLRIGIHVGDIIVEEKDIFGDGVNIASRVESFALPGSIFITENVFHEIRNHPDIKTTPIGKFEFKNVKEYIEIYAISNPGLVLPHQKKLAGKGKPVDDRKKWLKLSAVILILLIAAILFVVFFVKTASDKSIAALPFRNLSNNTEEEYLCEGFTEDILTSLSHFADFKIISFSSTKQYKGTTKPIKQIAAELGVAYILEGSLQHFGNNLHITAKLIKASDGTQIWAKSYTESFNEILAFQSEVSREIASALQITLSSNEKKQIEKHPTSNTDAYQLYLKGRFYWNQRTKENLDTALQYFVKATKLDPDYALAYSGIADVYTVLGDNGILPVDSISVNAKAALNKAMALDSSSAEVRTSYAIYLSSIEGNGTAALRQLESITSNNPNYASAFQWYALELSAKGRSKEAKEMIEKAIVLDPRSKRIYSSKALIYFNAGDFNNAIGVLKQAPEGFSDDLSYVKFIGNLYYLKGQTDSAAYYAQLCNNEILLKIINKDKSAFTRLITEKSLQPGATAEEIANFYTMAGEKDSAFVWLHKSVENKEFGGLKFLAVNPDWNTLRNDPRFALLLQNSGIR